MQLDLHLHILKWGNDEGAEVDPLNVVSVEINLVNIEGAVFAIQVNSLG